VNDYKIFITFQLSFGVKMIQSCNIQKASDVFEMLRKTKPATRKDLKNYIKVFLDLNIPDRNICHDHNSPMDYLWHSYSANHPDLLNNESMEDRRVTKDVKRTNADCIVWANRCGGKTALAAAATLLDGVFSKDCQVRILAGSGDQAGRLYRYLLRFLDTGFDRFLAEPALRSKCNFIGGSRVEVLNQSPTCVRGQHVQKLRCDEIELFEPEIFEAARFSTISSGQIPSAMELISTMHRPGGLMQKAIENAKSANVPVFKWCLWEVIEKCTDRSCSQCPLACYCNGVAKNATGYLKIDDCITAMQRSSKAAWQAEMLCIRPIVSDAVFDQFDPSIHVRPVEFDTNLPLYRSIDFGFVNPFVCLWIQVDESGVVRVVDEYVRTRTTAAENARELVRRTPIPQANVAGTFCDPAGAATEDVTGSSAVRQLRAAGISVRYRSSSILYGIELIRRAIRNGLGESRLVISTRCTRLIEAMQCYHYNSGGGQYSELPLKDGVYDHPIDALRYFFVNFTRPTSTESRLY
jgi:hypothetical protein